MQTVVTYQELYGSRTGGCGWCDGTGTVD